MFLSYARSSEEQAMFAERELRNAGYTVWRDAELPAHLTYADVIEERLKSAKAVLVLWSAEAAKSQWVRAEADAARELGTLVQSSVDGTIPPIPFNQIQCADLSGWKGNNDHAGWRKLLASIVALAGQPEPQKSAKRQRATSSVCVLPFQSMSGEPVPDYFSDGISEDIISDLSKVPALSVVPRKKAFAFKGDDVDPCSVAEKLGVSYVLEGTIRKAGERVRITAQLVDGSNGEHVWFERYYRDFTDIFAVQDEISKAIVDAVKGKLVPKDKGAVDNRETSSAEAYSLYVMAKEKWVKRDQADPAEAEAVEQLCKQAIGLDPNYARAWGLLALAQSSLRFDHGRAGDGGQLAADRALSIDPAIGEACCARAQILAHDGRLEEAHSALEVAQKNGAISEQELAAQKAYISDATRGFGEPEPEFEPEPEPEIESYFYEEEEVEDDGGWGSRGYLRRNPAKGLIGIGIILLLLAALAGYAYWSNRTVPVEERTATYEVTEDVKVRSLPTLRGSKILGELEPGDRITIEPDLVGAQEDWLKIKDGEYGGAYIWKESAKLISEGSDAAASNTADETADGKSR